MQLLPITTTAAILAFMVFAFASFTAAIAVEFFGPVSIPWWARACVPSRRGSTITGHLFGSLVCLILTAVEAMIVVWGGVFTLLQPDLASAAVFAVAAAVMGGWLLFLRGRYQLTRSE